VTVPAVAVGDRLGPLAAFLPIIPPSLVGEFAKAVGGQDPPRTGVGALVAMPAHPASFAQTRTLDARLRELTGDDTLTSGTALPQSDYRMDGLRYSALASASAAVVALAAAWVAAALAATDSRPDLATLSAVGAQGRTRRRIVAAQAGIVVGLGMVLGVLSGLPIGALFVLYERHRYQLDMQWTVAVPWLVIGALVVALPVLAMGAAWLATRTRVPLTRRIAG